MYSIDILYSTPQFFLWKRFSMKKHSLKHHFFIIGPLYPLWEHCHSEKLSRKKISLKNFLSEKYNFYYLCCVPPFFAKPFNILFSWKYSSMSKKLLGKKFQFSTSIPLTRTYKYVIQNCWLKKHSSFFKKNGLPNCNFCFWNHFCKPHWRILPKQSTLFWGEQNSRRRYFLQNVVFVSYQRSTALLLITMLWNFFERTFS